MLKKLKSWLADDAVYLGGILVLVGSISFGLGRLSIGNEAAISPQQAAIGLIASQNGPKLLVPPMPATTEITQATSTLAILATSSAPFVASKSSTKYHKVTCPGAKTIKETNKIYFSSESEAESAGYSKAANCKTW